MIQFFHKRKSTSQTKAKKELHNPLKKKASGPAAMKVDYQKLRQNLILFCFRLFLIIQTENNRNNETGNYDPSSKIKE